MLENYFPVLVFFIVAFVVALAPIVLGKITSKLIGTHKPDKAKLSPYECGFEEFEDARLPFDVRFYLVAILFIVFDLETAFFVPWAVVLKKIGWFGFGAMMVFLFILLVGFAYEWVKGGLEWE